jgi:hypothetical protein
MIMKLLYFTARCGSYRTLKPLPRDTSDTARHISYRPLLQLPLLQRPTVATCAVSAEAAALSFAEEGEVFELRIGQRVRGGSSRRSRRGRA